MSWVLLASMVVATTGVLLGALIGYLITRRPPRGYPSGDKQVRDLRPPPPGLQSPKPRPQPQDPQPDPDYEDPGIPERRPRW